MATRELTLGRRALEIRPQAARTPKKGLVSRLIERSRERSSLDGFSATAAVGRETGARV